MPASLWVAPPAGLGVIMAGLECLCFGRNLHFILLTYFIVQLKWILLFRTASEDCFTYQEELQVRLEKLLQMFCVASRCRCPQVTDRVVLFCLIASCKATLVHVHENEWMELSTTRKCGVQGRSMLKQSFRCRGGRRDEGGTCRTALSPFAKQWSP